MSAPHQVVASPSITCEWFPLTDFLKVQGVVGAASGAGIAIGAYFAFYGAASNLLARHTEMNSSGVAFVAGGIAAAGGSVVKVPLAVCIRSVQVHTIFDVCSFFPEPLLDVNHDLSLAGATLIVPWVPLVLRGFWAGNPQASNATE